MLYRNVLWIGLLLGLIFPALVFVILYQIFSLLELKGVASTVGFSENFRERTLAIVAIAINLWLLNIYRRRRWELAMRGVVIATTVLAIIWIVIFGTKLF